MQACACHVLGCCIRQTAGYACSVAFQYAAGPQNTRSCLVVSIAQHMPCIVPTIAVRFLGCALPLSSAAQAVRRDVNLIVSAFVISECTAWVCWLLLVLHMSCGSRAALHHPHFVSNQTCFDHAHTLHKHTWHVLRCKMCDLSVPLLCLIALWSKRAFRHVKVCTGVLDIWRGTVYFPYVKTRPNMG